MANTFIYDNTLVPSAQNIETESGDLIALEDGNLYSYEVDGGVWREIREMYLRDEGVWKAVNFAYVYDNSQWNLMFVGTFKYTVSSSDLQIDGSLVINSTTLNQWGYQGQRFVEITLPSGLTIIPNAYNIPALQVSSLPSEVNQLIINNYAVLMGRGGQGSNGPTYSSKTNVSVAKSRSSSSITWNSGPAWRTQYPKTTNQPSAGLKGTDAVKIDRTGGSWTCNFNNFGTINGGGGGGGWTRNSVIAYYDDGGVYSKTVFQGIAYYYFLYRQMRYFEAGGGGGGAPYGIGGTGINPGATATLTSPGIGGLRRKYFYGGFLTSASNLSTASSGGFTYYRYDTDPFFTATTQTINTVRTADHPASTYIGSFNTNNGVLNVNDTSDTRAGTGGGYGAAGTGTNAGAGGLSLLVVNSGGAVTFNNSGTVNGATSGL